MHHLLNLDFNSLQSKTLKDLVNMFGEQIEISAKSRHHLVILLDSVDQLKANSTAFNLSW